MHDGHLSYIILALNWQKIIATWACLGIIIVIACLVQYYLRKPKSIGHFACVVAMRTMIGMVQQSIPQFLFAHLCFITTLFVFILLCNIIALIPWFQEPTSDPNTTFALGVTAFCYVQANQIRVHGLWRYIKSYFSPLFLMFPVNVIGRVASVISLSLRLFGNIFGGFIITDLFFQFVERYIVLHLVIGLTLGTLLKLFFGLFEGCLQAFVFTMLSLTYLSLALQGEGH